MNVSAVARRHDGGAAALSSGAVVVPPGGARWGAGGGGNLAPRDGVAAAGVDAFTGVVRARNVRRHRRLDAAPRPPPASSTDHCALLPPVLHRCSTSACCPRNSVLYTLYHVVYVPLASATTTRQQIRFRFVDLTAYRTGAQSDASRDRGGRQVATSVGTTVAKRPRGTIRSHAWDHLGPRGPEVGPHIEVIRNRYLSVMLG